MATFFKNQGRLRIILDSLGTILTGYTCWIKYRKPDNIEGYWIASILAGSPTKMYYDILSKTIIDQSGVWTFWAYYFSGDDDGTPGEIVRQEFAEEGHLIESY